MPDVKLRITMVWLLLAGATLVSWSLAVTQNADEHAAHHGTTTLLFALAFGKVGLVMSEFMEVRGAPWPLRGICMAWIAIVFCAILFVYRNTPAIVG